MSGAFALVSALSNSPSQVRVLDLTANKLEAEGAMALAELLSDQRSPLHTLCVDFNNFSPTGIQYIYTHTHTDTRIYIESRMHTYAIDGFHNIDRRTPRHCTSNNVYTISITLNQYVYCHV